MSDFHKKKDMSQYKKVDHVFAHLNEYFQKGYRLFNLYHFRKTDELCIQLKDGKGNSVSVAYKCLYPVYRFPINQLPHEENIFESLYYLSRDRCQQKYVSSDILNNVGKLEDTKNRELKEYFNPEKILTYNVLRPEYYVSTMMSKDQGLTFEQTRICALDIETDSEGGKFPEPSSAKDPIGMVTVFDFKNLVANVLYMERDDVETDLDRIMTKIRDSLPDIEINFTVNLMPYNDEKTMISDLIDFLNENFDIVLGWNVNEFDFAYIINRAKQFELYLDFGVIYDGFSPAYVFKNFFCVDYISVFKFFVKKNSASMKLGDVAKEFIGVTKIQADTFLDIAYNIGDTFLVYLMDQKLNLINQMFSFKENGALLHVFNVRNALEPLFIKFGIKYNSVFIGNQYTNYYNIYYNEIYKFINHDILNIGKDDCHIFKTLNLVNFLSNMRSFESIIDFYMKKDEKEKKDDDDDKEDSAGTILSKQVEKIFRKRKKKVEDEEPLDIANLSVQKNFDYATESLDQILVKLYSLNPNTIYGYPGAFNKSFRGVSGDIIDLDFFSMYPCIIYGLNISFETAKFLAPFKLNILKVYDRKLYEEHFASQPNGRVKIYDLRKDKFITPNIDEADQLVYNSDSIIANNGMIYRKQIGTIPKMCEYFLRIRAKYKDQMKAESDPVLKAKYNIYQLLYKVYNNSIYGYMGYKYSVLFNRLLVSSVTVMGRSEILFANYRINTYLGEDKQAA